MTASFRGGRGLTPTTLSEGGRRAVYARFTRRSTGRRVAPTVDLRLLGPLEVRLGDGPVELGPRKQRAVLAMLALEAGRTVSADHLVEGLWGDEPPSSAAKMVQLYISHLRRAARRRRRADRHPRPRLRAAAAERRGGRGALRAAARASRARARRSRCGTATRSADVADEPFAAAEIRRLDELRLRAAETAIDADLAAGRHAEVIGELERARRGAAAARAPARPAHARAVPLRPPVRGARRLPRGARRRSWSRSASSRAPSCGGCTRRCWGRTRRSTCPRRPSPLRRSRRGRRRARRPRRLLVAAAAVLLAGIAAFGVIRVLEPEGLPGIGEDAVGRHRSGRRLASPRSTRSAAPRTPSTSGGGSVWVANQLDGTVSRHRRAARAGRHDPGRRRARRARVRRRLAVGGGRRRARRRPGRSRLQQGRAADRGRRTRRKSLAVAARRAVGGLRRRRQRAADRDRRGTSRARSASARRRPRSPPAPARSG